MGGNVISRKTLFSRCFVFKEYATLTRGVPYGTIYTFQHMSRAKYDKTHISSQMRQLGLELDTVVVMFLVQKFPFLLTYAIV